MAALEPGERAYHARFDHLPEKHRESWASLDPVAKAIWARVEAACQPEPADGSIAATQITLGEGLVDITTIRHEGRVGVLFRPRAEHIPFGEPGELPEGEYWPVPADVVLWVAGEGPGVAIDALSALAGPAPEADESALLAAFRAGYTAAYRPGRHYEAQCAGLRAVIRVMRGGAAHG